MREIMHLLKEEEGAIKPVKKPKKDFSFEASRREWTSEGFRGYKNKTK